MIRATTCFHSEIISSQCTRVSVSLPLAPHVITEKVYGGQTTGLQALWDVLTSESQRKSRHWVQMLGKLILRGHWAVDTWQESVSVRV